MAEKSLNDIIDNLHFQPNIMSTETGRIEHGTTITFTYKDGSGVASIFTTSTDENEQMQLVFDRVKKHQSKLAKLKELKL